MNLSDGLTQAIRADVLIRLGLTPSTLGRVNVECHYCGRQGWAAWGRTHPTLYPWAYENPRWKSEMHGPAFHFDHVIPVSWGGPPTAENLVLACQHCNSARRDHYGSTTFRFMVQEGYLGMSDPQKRAFRVLHDIQPSRVGRAA